MTSAAATAAATTLPPPPSAPTTGKNITNGSTGGHKIKVVCRVRPFLPTEYPDDSVKVESSHVLRVSNYRDPEKDICYNFDSCYGPEADQQTIYDNDVRFLVQNIFHALDTTVFCYGVTGAGKTHTIQGSDDDPGIIPRALQQILDQTRLRQDISYEVTMSYYQIYKEAVFDLLCSSSSTSDCGSAQSSMGLPIREDANRNIFIAGLVEQPIASYSDFAAIYGAACKQRKTASTRLNQHSSRSHAILTINVQWTDSARSKSMRGRLHLIDLAGSEDNRRTDNSGRDRMAESSAINKSLFVLGQVVEALNTGAHRVPYRDSKMTRVLQHSLGGKSVGMMIVNVAPGERFLQDTHNTLNFATKSRDIVNKPVVNEVLDSRWSVAAERLYGGTGQARQAGLAKPLKTSQRLKRSRDSGGSGNDDDDINNNRPDSAMSDGCNGGHNGLDSRSRQSQRQHQLRRLASSSGHNDSCQPLPPARQTAAGASRRSAGALPRLGNDEGGSSSGGGGGGLQKIAHASASGRNGIKMSYAPNPRFVEDLVTKRFLDIREHTEEVSTALNERLTRLEKSLGHRLSENEVLDLLSPTTKLKNSKAWLAQARKFEKEGKLRDALTRYEHARQYAPNLRKLEAHIAKLKQQIASMEDNSISGQKREAVPRHARDKGSSVDSDTDGTSLSDPESPGAEKALRKRKAEATDSDIPNMPAKATMLHKLPVFNPPSDAAADGAENAGMPKPKRARHFIEKRRTSQRLALKSAVDEGSPVELAIPGSNHVPSKPVISSVFQSVAFFKNTIHDEDGVDLVSAQAKGSKKKSAVASRRKMVKLNGTVTTTSSSIGIETPEFIFRVPSERNLGDHAPPEFPLQNSRKPIVGDSKKLLLQPTAQSRHGHKPKRAKSSMSGSRVPLPSISDDDDSDDDRSNNNGIGDGDSLYLPDALSPQTGLDQEYEYMFDDSGGSKQKRKRKVPKLMSEFLRCGPQPAQIGTASMAANTQQLLAILNSMEIKSITKLKGIGKKRAEQISQYVQLYGPLDDVEQLRKLAGFSDNIINSIKSTVFPA
ncbi:hypothetical protein EV182_002337 [Spiromyces aspiralis]|uniref:Uncharacterized protein n=1 Tax=Spiromyces aspiralis TaxID=68401 RepID=A0ACC1HZH9_9FUNG|nr:hypothetical protein EV182_002337 [Spiromyces aspiralis]